MDLDSQSSEVTIEKAKKILGKSAEGMTDEELQNQLVLMKSLVESWMDDYESSIFDGKTLYELLASS